MTTEQRELKRWLRLTGVKIGSQVRCIAVPDWKDWNTEEMFSGDEGVVTYINTDSGDWNAGCIELDNCYWYPFYTLINITKEDDR